jgi:acid stress-induced BolA-like protein IbaG/YrbA
MVKGTLKKRPAFVDKLENALHRDMPGAEIVVEHMRDERYRFEVVWNKFSNIGHPKRQRRVWAIVEKVVPQKHIWDVGMILTIAPEELPAD